MFKNLIAVVAAIVILGGCGGGGGNDNGGSVTAIGTYSGAPEELTGTELPPGNIGTIAPMGAFSFINVFLGVTNNMTEQSWRSQYAELSFDIPGASQNPPDTTSPLPGFTGPIAAVGVISPIPNRMFAEFSVVPAATMQWIVSNQSLLPALPFTMNISIRAVGVTAAGNSLRTNVIGYAVYFVDEASSPGSRPSSSSSSSAG